MSLTIDPFLMFEGAAEDAIRFYVATFPDARILSLDRYGPEEEGVEGSIKLAVFELAGRRFRCTDSPISHGFTFTPSLSLFVTCAEPSEVERLADELAEGGETLMPVGEYGFSRRFAWVQDRFGVSWQLNCA